MHPLSRRAFGALTLSAIAAAAAAVAAQTQPQAQLVKLTVKKFEYSPERVTVRKGIPVVIEITSLDRIHGFKLPDFNLRTDVIPGEVARVSFTPSEEGEFPYLCDVFCGDGHENVTGTLVVKA